MAHDCIAEMVEAAAGKLSRADAERVFKRLERFQKAQKADSQLRDIEGAALDEAKRIGDEAKVAALVEKRSRAINVLRKTQRGTRYDTAATPSARVRRLRDLNVGSEGGKADSIDAERLGLEAKFTGMMIGELRKGGLLDLLRARMPEFDRDVAREMWRITGGTGEPGSNKAAIQVAEIISKYQELSRVVQNDAGAWIRKMPGYVVRQTHDPYRLNKRGYQAWRDAILPKLDDRTFDNWSGDQEEFLQGVFAGLSTGEHLRSNGGDWLGGFKGPGNLAKRVSQERVLHFKSADDWFDYNQEFGGASLLEAVSAGLHSAARNAAVMRTWGTNPEAAFQADLDQMAQQLVRQFGDKDAAKALKKLRSGIVRAEFDQVTGATNIPGNITAATWSQTVRNIQNFKLGAAVISSITDVPAKAAALRHNGIGFLDGLANGFADVFRGMKAGERREAADMIGVGIDGLIGSVAQRFSAAEGIPGKASRMMDLFFKANLLTWWTDAHQAGAGLMLARNLAKNADRDFDNINPDLRFSLQRYGIEARQWEMVRQAASEVPGVGSRGPRRFITPDMIDRLPDEAIAAYAGKSDAASIRRTKLDLELALRSYLSETSNEAMTIAGARERAFITRGYQPGTFAGESIRFFAQFKTFGVTYLMRHVGRELHRKGRVDYKGMALMLTSMTMLGYVAMMAKDIAKGREPRRPDPDDPMSFARIFGAAFVQGGGAGIYGDFLFGEASRFGQGALDTFLGPTFGTAQSAADVIYRARSGDDPSAQLVKQIINQAPNLFYTRVALDYMFLYQIQEAMNPGFLKRMEKRIKDENNQSFMFPPSKAIPRGGGDRIFEGVRG